MSAGGGGLHYIPHKAVMYLKREAAKAMGEEFRTKPEIAFERMIKPLKVPEGVKLYVVYDSWWFSTELVSKTLALGYNYHTVCQLKSDKKVVVNRNEKKLAELAKGLKYRKVCIEVRGSGKNEK